MQQLQHITGPATKGDPKLIAESNNTFIDFAKKNNKII